MEQIKDKIKFDRYTCEDEYGKLLKYEPEYYEIQLYIVFGYECNADCDFCVYHTKHGAKDFESKGKVEGNTLNISQLEAMLKDIQTGGFYIQTVHLTGGEPTLNFENFTEVLKLIRRYLGNLVTISVNTNGIHLKELGKSVEQKLLDNIALSRHGLTDKENQEIFKTTEIPSNDDIKQFVDMYGQVVHLSCNLVKGYVDTADRIVGYLEMAGKLGVNDVGIVQLMNKNSYCNERYVEYKDISTDLERLGLVRTRQHVKRDNPLKTDKHGKKCGNIICACENYLYTTKEYKMVQMYHRFAIQSDSIESYLVYYSGELKQGFSGSIIKNY